MDGWAPPGWYPDPTGGPRLRWWDGEDWTEAFRTRPSSVEMASMVDAAAAPAAVGIASADLDRLAGVMRTTARSEMDRAIKEIQTTATGQVDRVVNEVRTQARKVEPLITEAAGAIGRWMRRAAIFAFLLLVVWLFVQWLVGIGTAELIGDIVDRITEAIDGSGSTP